MTISNYIQNLRSRVDFTSGYEDVAVSFGNITPGSSRVIYHSTTGLHQIELTFSDEGNVTIQQFIGDTDDPRTYFYYCEIDKASVFCQLAADAVHKNKLFSDLYNPGDPRKSEYRGA